MSLAIRKRIELSYWGLAAGARLGRYLSCPYVVHRRDRETWSSAIERSLRAACAESSEPPIYVVGSGVAQVGLCEFEVTICELREATRRDPRSIIRYTMTLEAQRV